MLIINADIFRGGRFREEDLRIAGERIVEIVPRGTLPTLSGEEVIDGDGCWLIPGLTDMHSHGAAGYDFDQAEPEGLRKVLEFQALHGITQYCPTGMSLPAEQLHEIYENGAKVAAESSTAPRAMIAGFHMEGPFLNTEKSGAQYPGNLRVPDADYFRKIQDASENRVRVVTIAPELEGAIPFIETFSRETLISLGHTTADYELATRAFRAGARHLTHLFNAMSPLHHRKPGVIGAAMDHPEISVEIIADGIHVHPAMVRMAFRLFSGRIALVSDSMRACGLADGVSELGGQKVQVKGAEARLENGSLAGSATHLADCLRNVISWGIGPEEAIAAATETPAGLLEIADVAGTIRENAMANLILTDKELNFRRVFVAGNDLSF